MKLRLFILKLALLLAPLLIGLIYVEYRLSRIPNSFALKRANLEHQSDSVEVLVLGASHNAYGINPTYFSHKGFNLATPSQDMYYDSALLMNYLPQLHKLKLVFIENSYLTLNYSLENSIEQWREHFYYKFWGIKSYTSSCFHLSNYLYTALYSNSVVMDVIKKGFDTNFAENVSYSGWMRFSEDTNGSVNDSSGKKRVAFHNQMIAANRSGNKMRRWMENLVVILRKKQIQVVFISAPVYSTYSKFLDSNITNRNNSFIDSLCKKYNCSYFNYSKDIRFTLGDFYDNDHLNYLGAEKFSKIIDKDIIKPLLH
jgi:hypothetical protein